jgi:hypothetical protein
MSKAKQKEEAKRLSKAGDHVALAALLVKAPHIWEDIRSDVKYAKDPDFVIAFAEKAAVDTWTNRELGMAAATKRDWPLLARAFAPDLDEENYVLWTFGAKQMYEAGDVEGAHAICTHVIGQENASPDDWNTWLLTLRETKASAELAARLERAAAIGPKLPLIFHNIACAWLRVGDAAKAIAAVESAVQYGYDPAGFLDDDELAPIRKDKRFVAACKTKRAFDLAAFETTMSIHRKDRLVMRPVFGMYFYFAEPPSTVGPAMAAAIEQYIAQIAPVELTHYKSGRWNALKKGGLKQQLAKLRKNQFADVAMRDVDGDATDFAFSAELRGVSELVFTYPRTLDPEVLYTRFVEFARALSPESGSAGYTLAQRDNCNVYEGVSWDSATVYARCLGFERHPMREWNPGTAGAHWLTLLDAKLAKKCGGVAALKKAIGKAKLEEIDGAVVIRAAKRPPIGLATNPADIGALPSVAKAIAKVRSHDKADKEKSYARFDALEPAAYDNG